MTKNNRVQVVQNYQFSKIFLTKKCQKMTQNCQKLEIFLHHFVYTFITRSKRFVDFWPIFGLDFVKRFFRFNGAKLCFFWNLSRCSYLFYLFFIVLCFRYAFWRFRANHFLSFFALLLCSFPALKRRFLEGVYFLALFPWLFWGIHF